MDIIPEHTSGTGSASKKADKRKQTIIVITAIVGVILTYLLYRRSQAAQAFNGTATSSPDSSPAPNEGIGTGGSSGGGADYSGAMNTLGSQLAQLTTANSTLRDSLLKDEQTYGSQIASLTNQSSHLRTTVSHLEHNKGVQEAQIKKTNKHVATLTKELQHKHPAQHKAVANTSGHKKAAKR